MRDDSVTRQLKGLTKHEGWPIFVDLLKDRLRALYSDINAENVAARMEARSIILNWLVDIIDYTVEHETLPPEDEDVLASVVE